MHTNTALPNICAFLMNSVHISIEELFNLSRFSLVNLIVVKVEREQDLTPGKICHYRGGDAAAPPLPCPQPSSHIQ